MAVSADIIELHLTKYFQNNAEWKLIDLLGDNDHYELTITSSLFNDLSLVKQHKMVNEALKDLLVQDLHALKIVTKKQQ
jgi:stress-induced morphogen